METIKNVNKKIKDAGVIRFEYPGIKYNPALKNFISIANELLIDKEEIYSYQDVKNAIEFIICWLYLKTDNIDFKKGFMLKGPTGSGKTFIFKILQHFVLIDNLRFKFDGKEKPLIPKIVNVKKISGEYQHPETGGYPIINKYSKLNCLVIDDIGFEPVQSKHFGNSLNVVEEIISNREHNNLLTFATTNLEEFKKTYDDRIISRMNKLFKSIPIEHGKDFRINPNKIDE